MTLRFTFAALGTAALLLTSTAVSAQTRFSDVDTNGDGRLSYEELENRFGAAAANRFLNRNGGDELTRADVRRLNSDDDDDDGRDDDDDDDDDDDGRDDDDDDGRDDDDDDGRDDDGRDDDDDDGRDDDDDDGGRDGGDDSGGGGDDDDD